MAEPKKKRSKTRTNRARAAQIAPAIELTTCTNCKAQIQPHRVCVNCGHYKGTQVIA
jgi:large subunit ribosomal protein L32